jgi:hypothetical protein
VTGCNVAAIVRVSGFLMRSCQLFLRSRGTAATRRVEQVLGGDATAYLRAGFLETRWYPMELFVDLAESIDEGLRNGDDLHGAIARELGRFACEQSLTGTHRLLFKFGDIGWLLDRASTAWREHFDEGSISVVERIPGRAILLQLDGIETPSPIVCMMIQGWMERAAELTGEDRVHCEHRCRSGGDDVCQWRFAWKRA